MRDITSYAPGELGTDGLTKAHEWVRVGGCPVWRGYDPAPGSMHDAGELAFAQEMGARNLECDRCQCGGLAAWDEAAPDALNRMDAHYPPEFVEQAHQTTLSAPVNRTGS